MIWFISQPSLASFFSLFKTTFRFRSSLQLCSLKLFTICTLCKYYTSFDLWSTCANEHYQLLCCPSPTYCSSCISYKSPLWNNSVFKPAGEFCQTFFSASLLTQIYEMTFHYQFCLRINNAPFHELCVLKPNRIWCNFPLCWTVSSCPYW